MLDKLINFLHSELEISSEAIALAQKTPTQEPNILLMILWQYGLLDRTQLDQVLDWLETT